MNEMITVSLYTALVVGVLTLVLVTSNIKRDCDKMGMVILYGNVYTCDAKNEHK